MVVIQLWTIKIVGSKVSGYVKSTRVKQVMADLALVHVANHGVDSLTQSEYRRLAIGTQLVRDITRSTQRTC